MPDTPEDPSGPASGNLRVRNIRADRQLSREMTVQRLTVNSGEERSAESDLMDEVLAAITEQTKTLKDVMDDIDNKTQMQLNALRGMAVDHKALVAAIKQGRGSLSEPAAATPVSNIKTGETSVHDEDLAKAIKGLNEAIIALAESGGGGGGEGGHEEGLGSNKNKSDMARSIFGLTDIFENLGKTGKVSSAEVRKFGTEFVQFNKQNIFSQITANLTNALSSLQNSVASLLSSQNITRFVSDRFTKGMDMMATGSIHLAESFIPQILRSGDNLDDTFSLMRTTINSNMITPIGIMGDNLDEVSETLQNTRSTLRDGGNIAASRLGYEALNRSTMELVNIERRRDITASTTNPVVMARVDKNLAFASMIATNTGRTAEEVLAMNRAMNEKLASLETGGILEGAAAEGFQNLITGFQANNQQNIAALLAAVARSGGSLEAYLAQNPSVAEGLAATGQVGNLRDLIDLANGGSGGRRPEDYMSAAMGITGRFQDNPFGGVALASVMDDTTLGLINDAGLSKTFNPDKYTTNVDGAATGIIDFLKNTIGDGMFGLLGALTLNTAALALNTWALLGGGGLGSIAGFLGKGKGLIGKGLGAVGGGLMTAGRMGLGMLGLGGAAAATATGGGAAATAAGVGAAGLGAVGKAGAKGIAKLIPGLGLVLGLGNGAYQLWQGDYTGAALSIGAGVASTIPGVGTAVAAGLGGIEVGRELGMFDGSSAGPASVGPSSSTTDSGLINDTQRIMMEGNRILDRIVQVLEEHTSIFDAIERNTVRSSAQVSPGILDSFFGREAEIATHSSP